MGIADESLAELFEQYKDEVRETIGTLDTELVSIEQDSSNSEVIFSIFRHLHSLKGSSKMFNVENIGHIAHKLEDLMQLIDRDNSILAKHPRTVDLLFRGNDLFREIIARLEEDISFNNLTPEHLQFIEEIHHLLDRINRKDNALLESARRLIEELESLLPSLEEIDTEALRRAITDLTSNISLVTLEEGAAEIIYTYGGRDLTTFIRAYELGLEKFQSHKFTPADIDTFFQSTEEMIKALFEVAEEDLMGVLAELNDGLEMYRARSLEIDPIVIGFLQSVLSDLKERLKAEVGGPPDAKAAETSPDQKTATVRREPTQVQAKTIRVDEKKIDQFLDSVGKLITQSEILNHLQFSFKGAGINPALVRDFAAVNRTISNDIVSLQRSIMEVRQVEMDNILKKFPRLVRDLSHKMGKEVELAISGERIPIDKSLLDDVEQALIHIVRNAIDHGIETTEEREHLGKARRGRISVSVLQEEASLLIQVADDGRGLDFEAIRRRGLDRGFISKEQCQTLLNQEIEDLIFMSGLTTKAEATDISGRGVGLDVVRSNIKKWNGEVTLDNRPGEGLTVSFRIPITHTLLTKEAILLKLGTSMFCLPLEFVVEIVTVPHDRIHRHKQQVLFSHRNKVISVVDIKGLLGIAAAGDENQQPTTFIILRGKTEENKSIAADEILGQQKIVIKNFEIEAFRQLPYILGLTLMGDGRVVLILDAETIVD